MQTLLDPFDENGSLKDGWEEKQLSELLSYEQPTKYLVSSTEYLENGDIPVLTAGKTFVLGFTSENYGFFDNLPVIIFDDFTTASKYVDFKFKAKSSAMKMLLPKNESVNLKFVFELMQRIDFPLGDHKRHWIGEYQNLKVTLPSPDEQVSISEILSDMDSEVIAFEKKLEKTRNLKQGMMQQLLTGKIRLVDVPYKGEQ